VAGICDRVVPGDAISATVRDVSEGGIGLLVADLRPRTKDYYRLDVRFFEGHIRQEVRVRSRRPTARPGGQILGCEFIFASAETLDVVQRLLVRLGPRAEPRLREQLAATAA
jgi:hypothetical protein